MGLSVTRAALRAWALERLKGEPAADTSLRHRQEDADLAGVRDADALAKLPEAERQDWEALWAEVDRLLTAVVGP